MVVMDTSIEAYYSPEPDKDLQRAIILDVIRTVPDQCSREIAQITKLPRTSVTGRLRELETDGVIAKGVKKKDSITNKTVYTYYIVGGIVDA